MKRTLIILLLAIGLYAATIHSAKVLQTMNSGGYTYIKVKDNNQSYWIAMTQRDVKIGESIEYIEQGWIQNFHSKTLNRTFDKILFAADVQAQQDIHKKTPPDIMHSKYQEKGTQSIAELFKERKQYANTKVTVKGKVTKVSKDIMRRNWVHIEDGSRFKGMDVLSLQRHKTRQKLMMSSMQNPNNSIPN